MAVLSYKQVQTLLRDGGFPESEIVRMAAICRQESGLRTDAVNPGFGAGGKPTKEYSVGLFQINTLVHKNFTREQLKDPVTNVKEALRIYKTQGLRAWGGYTDGGYKKYVSSSQAAYSGANVYDVYPGKDDDKKAGQVAAISTGGVIVFGLVLYLILD